MHSLAVVAAALVLAGCTFNTMTPRTVIGPPPTPARTLVIGTLNEDEPQWQSRRTQYVRDITEWVRRNGGFAEVVDGAAGPAPEGSVILVTRITNYDKGNAVLRVLVGMGAGQAEIRGEVEIRDRAGAVLLSFESKESYLGGSGIGGAGFLDMDDLMRRFAESAAEATVKWSRGQSIK